MSYPSNSDGVAQDQIKFVREMPAERSNQIWRWIINGLPRFKRCPRIDRAEQAFHLDYSYDIAKDCASLVDRFNHRAIWLLGQVLGVEYEMSKLIYEARETMPATDVVERFPDFISRGVDEGFCYFAEDVAANRIKVGYSLNPLQRIDRLSSAINRPLVLLGLWQSTMLMEHWFHCQLRDCRIAGEWFRADELRQHPKIGGWGYASQLYRNRDRFAA